MAVIGGLIMPMHAHSLRINLWHSGNCMIDLTLKLFLHLLVLHSNKYTWTFFIILYCRYIMYCREFGHCLLINLSLVGQNGRHLADGIFKRIFLNHQVRFLIKIPLKFVPVGSFNDNQALVYIMTRHRIDDKISSEPMLTDTIHLRIYATLRETKFLDNIQWFQSMCVKK